jgi:hypothetical protein
VKQQKYVIYTREQLLQVLERMATMEIAPGRPCMMTFGKYSAKRNNDQNALYWSLLGEIAEQAFVEGRAFSADSWHEYMKLHVMPTMVELASGEIVPKWVELPGGGRIVRSTTELSKACFADYITLVEKEGASIGVFFSADPNMVPPTRTIH